MNRIRQDAVLWLLFASLAGASAAASTDQGDSLDEVLVEGKRGELLQEMVKVEDRFFARYNELNTKNDFDTSCHMEARVGTRVERRYCRAVFVDKALETEGRDHMEARKKMLETGVNPPIVHPWAPPVPPTLAIAARQKDYQQNMREVVRQHPELIELLRERYELGKRYDATRKRGSGPKPPAQNEQAISETLLP